ncbi:MAG TPA: L-lactate permease [Thermomicrobiales bacterium]|nr:L-lactate permease [Thermomicrobiales bacterium]
MLPYAAIIGLVAYRQTGKFQPGAVRMAIARTVSGALSSSIGIVTMSGMALLIMESGMTLLLAQGIADVAVPAFPLLAPVIGVLGCFITCSNTNSNNLIGALQRDSALVLGVPPAIILAAQTNGEALGSMLAPRQKSSSAAARADFPDRKDR